MSYVIYPRVQMNTQGLPNDFTSQHQLRRIRSILKEKKNFLGLNFYES